MRPHLPDTVACSLLACLIIAQLQQFHTLTPGSRIPGGASPRGAGLSGSGWRAQIGRGGAQRDGCYSVHRRWQHVSSVEHEVLV